MSALTTFAFAPNAFDGWSDVYSYRLLQRRGFNHFSNNDDPNIHDRILGMQRGALAHLLHPNVLLRFSDAALYGNEYKLTEYMADLTSAIFDADKKTSVNTFRQGLQVEYLNRLIKAMDVKNGYDPVSRGVVVSEINKIEGIAKLPSTDDASKAHRQHLLWIIEESRK
jgi:hypothetical protein